MAPKKKSLTSKLNEAAGNPVKTSESITPQPANTPDTIRLKDIQPRAENTRAINENHARALMESIRVLGLIEPIVTDANGVLLAGGHRHWALNTLIIENPEDFEKQFPGAEIPVRRMDFRAEDDPKRALDIEIGENEHRRDYTANEIKDIIERLKAAGYKELKGRPKKGEQSVMDAVSHIIGKSKRRIQVILKSDKSANNVALSETDQRDQHLKAAISALEKWKRIGGKGRKKRESELASKIDSILDDLNKGLE